MLSTDQLQTDFAFIWAEQPDGSNVFTYPFDKCWHYFVQLLLETFYFILHGICLIVEYLVEINKNASGIYKYILY